MDFVVQVFDLFTSIITALFTVDIFRFLLCIALISVAFALIVQMSRTAKK